MGNYSYNFNSKRYVILMIIVLLLFSIFIFKAFDYLPEQPNDINNINSAATGNINSSAENNNTNNYVNDDNSSDNEEYNERHKSGHFDFMPKSQYDKQDMVEVQAPPGTNEEKITVSSENTTSEGSDENALKCITNGKKYIENRDYTNALTEFQKVDELTNDSELRAMGYDGIAEVYAHNRRFGTALTFANKANYASPSPSREMTIARINYLSGNTDTAITQMNKILKQGF